MRLGAKLGRAAAVLSIAAVGAAVAVPAQAADFDSFLSISVEVDDSDAEIFDGLTFEIFDGEGALAFEIDAMTAASAVPFPGGGECYVSVSDLSASTISRLSCGDIPLGDYIVGAAASDPSLAFEAYCSAPLPPEPALGGTGEVTIEHHEDMHCTLSPYYGGAMIGILGSGIFTYSDTFIDFGELEYRLTGGTGVDMVFDGSSGTGTAYPTCDYADVPFGGVAVIVCEDLPKGTYTLTGTNFPEGAVVGEMTCAAVSEYGDEPSDLRESSGGFTIERAGDLVYCVQYIGTGIPIFVDVDSSQVDVPLADIVIELYDEDGALVAEGTDPSEAVCVPAELVDPESPYDLVLNPEDCAVLMVAPPFALPFSGPESGITLDWDSTSYSIGLRGPGGALGASSASATVNYMELGGLAEPVGVEGSTAVLATDWDSFATPSGAVMSVTAEAISTPVVPTESEALPELPETGPTSPWAPAAAASSTILLGAFLLMRRRAQI